MRTGSKSMHIDVDAEDWTTASAQCILYGADQLYGEAGGDQGFKSPLMPAQFHAAPRLKTLTAMLRALLR